MAFVPLPNGIRITWVFTLFSRPITVTVHVTSPTAITPTVLTQARDAAIAVWDNGIRPAISNNVTLTALEATDVSVPDGQQLRQVTFTNPAGAIASAPMPNNVAVVVSLRTGFTGRSRRGRIYIPGLPAGDVSANTLISAAALRFSTLAAQLRTQFETAGLQLVVASYVSNGAPRLTAVATPVTSAPVSARVDTQRRRLPKGI